MVISLLYICYRWLLVCYKSVISLLISVPYVCYRCVISVL